MKGNRLISESMLMYVSKFCQCDGVTIVRDVIRNLLIVFDVSRIEDGDASNN